MTDTLYVIDGHSQIFRAYHALRPGSMTSPTGEPTWATHIFTTMLLKFISERQPTYLAMAVDGPRSELKRTALYPEYKAHRPPMPDDLLPQEQRIFQLVETLGIPILRVKGYEADDILATLAERYGGDYDVILVSRDKDLDQLVTDHVKLYDPMKDELWDAAAIEAKKGYTPAQAVEVQTLMGDSTDNIPGIEGVGPKTAAKLIAQYGTVDAVLAAADQQTPKLRERLQNAGEAVQISRQLVTLDRHVPIETDLDQWRPEKLNYAALRPLFAELGFGRLNAQLDKLAGPADEPVAKPAMAAGLFNFPTEEPVSTPAPATKFTAAEDFEYTLIDTPEALAELAEQLRAVKRLAVDTETTGVQPMWCSLVGVCLAWTPGKGVYIPVAGPLGAQVLDADAVRDALAPVLADETVEKIGHNLKYDLIVLENAGYTLAGPMFDTMIAAHVLDSSRMSYKMDDLAMEYLRHECIPIKDLIGSGRNSTTMDKVPTDVVSVYAAEDADVTLRLADLFAPKLKEEKLDSLFDDLEMPLMPVLADMERTGILVDPQMLKAMQVELSAEADRLRDRIIELAGRPFNPDSPKQLSEVLFTEMRLPAIKKTKTGESTDSSVLEQLASEHDCEIAAVLLDYRKLMKLISTYLDALGKCIHPRTHRVHTSFHQASVATGRLSSSDPNLQNIPVRSEEGKKIRSAFIADDGFSLLAGDYSQVELRMLAHFCKDETLCAAFADDQDIHRIVAAEVFGVPLDEVTSEQRGRAKTVNFGIIYGQTGFGLARTLRIQPREASEFIRQYKARFPKIEEFLQTCVEQARQNGYVETIFKRRRTIHEIDARNPQRRAAAERLAINSVVQGSAADLIKQAMIQIARRIDAEQRPSRMLLQIHDELVFEVPNAAIDAERDMIREEMIHAIELDVPLKVDIGVGQNWMEAK